MAIRALARAPITQRMIFRLFAQTWITYRSSPLSTHDPRCPAGVRAGDRIAPDLLGTDARASRHRPLLVTGDTTTPTQTASAVTEVIRRFLPADPVTTIDRHTRRGRRLGGTGPDRIILARPDGHTAYVGPPDDLHALREYLDRWYLPT